MILTLSMSLGPGLTLVGLGTVRPPDDWDPAVVRAILVAGNALLLPACAVRPRRELQALLHIRPKAQTSGLQTETQAK